VKEVLGEGGVGRRMCWGNGILGGGAQSIGDRGWDDRITPRWIGLVWWNSSSHTTRSRTLRPSSWPLVHPIVSNTFNATFAFAFTCSMTPRNSTGHSFSNPWPAKRRSGRVNFEH